MYPDDFLSARLQLRKDAGALRSLTLSAPGADFFSNDYLGMVYHQRLRSGTQLAGGATGSRLLSGNFSLAGETEAAIAAFHDAEAALLFNSGYDANIGLLSSVPQKGDTILYDQLSHASIRDGIRLSFAGSFSFAHNDMEDLEKKLSRVSGRCFIVTESVFSMDGDTCPLKDMVAIAGRYGAHLIIDEAHATGVIGGRGEGLVQSEGLQHKIFARVHTFGKACGCHGAVVLGSDVLRSYLINFARSLVFTTALPPQAVAHIAEAYALFPQMQTERAMLTRLVTQFREADMPFEKLPSLTPIQGVLVPGNAAARALAGRLQGDGLAVRPILYPTVPLGKERLRIVLHSFNTPGQLSLLTEALRQGNTGVFS